MIISIKNLYNTYPYIFVTCIKYNYIYFKFYREKVWSREIDDLFII